MKKDDWTGILIVVGIIAIGLFSGFKNTGNTSPSNSSAETSTGETSQSSTNLVTTEQKQKDLQQKIKEAQVQVENLKKQIQAEEDRKTQSQYKDMVSLTYVSHSTNSSKEYVVIRATNATTSINITGWRLVSQNTGTSVTIPQGTYLFFTSTVNALQDIYITGNDTVYLVTGISPVGTSFKVNKCSGYFEQFQNFAPYLSTSCPAPRDENLSEIPRLSINNSCFDYIDSFPKCRIQTEPLPTNWSYECKNFITTKVSYASCINIHKEDKDFYGHEWRVYLRRGESLWKNSSEDIVLYDNLGKVVSELKY